MLSTTFAEYGIAIFSVAGMIFLGYCFIKSRNNATNGDSLKEVIINNTRAVESLIPLIQSLQVTMVEIKAQQGELLARARE